MNISYKVCQLKTFFTSFSNYSFIVVDKTTKAALIVDPAWELDKVTASLSELDADLVAILLTHSHYDHVNLVSKLVKKFNCSVFMSKIEIDYYHFRCSNLNALNDMDEMNVGETAISCILTPGHTAGGMCYHLADCLFTGDTIFVEGCGICSTKGGSVDQMYDSIQRVKSMVPPSTRIYPGHSFGKNPGHTVDDLMRENIYFLLDKKHFVDFRMRKNQKGLFDFG